MRTIKHSGVWLLTVLIASLTAVEARAEGDAERGRELYTVCATCHGEDARGNPDTQAPQLAGQFQWYLVRQLENFKSGVRGTHEGDVYGQVMKPMADTLSTRQDMEDVAAYIVSKRPTRQR